MPGPTSAPNAMATPSPDATSNMSGFSPSPNMDAAASQAPPTAPSVPSSAETNGLVWPGDSSSSQPGAPAQAQAPASMVNGTPAGGAAPAVRKTAGFVPMSDVGKPFHTTLSDPTVQHGFLHSKIAQVIEGKSDQWVQPVDADGNPTGAPVNQPKQNSPGFFFRSLLAGVLAGAASGAGHGVAGAGMGWNAATEMQDKQKAEAHAQAQEQWQNQRQVTEDAQKATAATDEHLHVFALTNQANTATLEAQRNLLGASIAQHKQAAEDDKGELDSILAFGLKPAYGPKGIKYEGIGEKEAWTMEHAPGYTSQLRWLRTGTAPTYDKDGNIVSYQSILSAFDVNGIQLNSQMPLTPSMLAHWKDSGYLEANPNLLTSNIVKTNKKDGSMTMSYADFRNVESQAAPMLAQKRKAQAEADARQEIQDKHDMAVAAENRDKAQQKSAELTGSNEASDLKTKKDAKAAGVKYNAVGWEPLTPEEKFLVQPMIQHNIDVAESALKSPALKEALENAADPAGQKKAKDEALGYLQTIQDESKKLMGPQKAKLKEDEEKTISGLITKYASGMSSEASTNFTGAAQSLQQGTPLSTILTKLATSRDLSDEDKKAIAEALPKLNEEMSPVLEARKQSSQQTTSVIQQAANKAWDKEHPNQAAMASSRAPFLHF